MVERISAKLLSEQTNKVDKVDECAAFTLDVAELDDAVDAGGENSIDGSAP